MHIQYIIENIRAVKQSIATINRIQNKFLYVCNVYIYFVYINANTYSLYFENVYIYLHIHFFILQIIFTCIQLADAFIQSNLQLRNTISDTL